MQAEDRESVAAEYPSSDEGYVYFNSGCCGRKPLSVLDAMARAYERINTNPCHFTFRDTAHLDQARQAAANLLSVPREQVLLAFSTTNALQVIMQSFLLKAGDELVTTDHEHGSLNTIARYLSETRGVVVRRHAVPVDAEDSQEHCRRLLALVNEKTKLVALSEIVSYTGWRPDLSALVATLQKLDVPLLIDCAHGPGLIRCLPDKYPLWVGSAHKWLGAPNGTAVAYVSPSLAARLVPVNLGDTYYGVRDLNEADLSRLEGTGTADLAKWRGFTRAVDLHMSLGIESVVEYQRELARYLRAELKRSLYPVFRIDHLFESRPQECTSIVNFRFPRERLRVPNLQDYLWDRHKIAVQLDYLGVEPAHGMRISCHVSNTRADVDRLVEALNGAVLK
ncbi:MAG: aminotransferase class V-fold PLP-dependent enzyme [Cyanobacteria bacterium SZAS TMP-1]|nr:aminotransferase class V-fold PLP-dependent enzyme [Cyanobacteria bacterium SZAS TMP-1]